MVQIIRGERKTISVQIYTSDCDSITGFKNLAAVNNVSACFRNEDGTLLELTSDPAAGVTIIDAATGKIEIEISAAQSDLLALVKNETLEITLDFGSGNIDKVQIKNAYSVLASLC